jgi:hypothetical protein
VLLLGDSTNSEISPEAEDTLQTWLRCPLYKAVVLPEAPGFITLTQCRDRPLLMRLGRPTGARRFVANVHWLVRIVDFLG